jgi:hypothetical protein
MADTTTPQYHQHKKNKLQDQEEPQRARTMTWNTEYMDNTAAKNTTRLRATTK